MNPITSFLVFALVVCGVAVANHEGAAATILMPSSMVDSLNPSAATLALAGNGVLEGKSASQARNGVVMPSPPPSPVAVPVAA
jgi:hypothetical protein